MEKMLFTAGTVRTYMGFRDFAQQVRACLPRYTKQGL